MFLIPTIITTICYHVANYIVSVKELSIYRYHVINYIAVARQAFFLICGTPYFIGHYGHCMSRGSLQYFPKYCVSKTTKQLCNETIICTLHRFTVKLYVL